MNIYFKKRFIIMLMAIMASAPLTGFILFEDAWDDFPPPPDSLVQEIVKDSVVNGLPQSIKIYTSEKSVEQVVEFYRKEWQNTGVGPPIVDDVEKKKIVSLATEEGYFFTVMAEPRAGSGSIGHMSIAFLNRMKEDGPKLGADFPMPEDSQVASDMVSHDFGKRARMILLRNSHSMDYNKRFYNSSFKFDGWILTKDSRTPKSKGRGVVLEFKRGIEVASIVITDEIVNTTVLANIVTPE
jgi:hypothetical protein